jgi:4-hydroxybenzoate polyprenyltransferase
LKAEVARRARLDVETLPYDAEILEHLKEARRDGRRLLLTTAADRQIAEQVAGHLGLFDAVLASDGATNLKGQAKCAQLVEHCGEGRFDYLGNGRPDLHVWSHARAALLAKASATVERAARCTARVERVFAGTPARLQDYVRALRPHQWAKNVLVFVPLLAAHRATEAQALFQTLLAFIAFGLCASSVYVLNDLLDLPADRRHPRKRERPFASGLVPVIHGIPLTLGLLAAAFGLASLLPIEFVGALALYYVATSAYSFRLKRIVLIDVLILAGLYTLRVIAGGTAIGQPSSFWLLAFSMFLFMSLALAKRYSELLAVRQAGGAQAHGRDYYPSDLGTLIGLGSAAGYMAVLVLALYINSDDVREIYRLPEAIWLLCPLLLYWVSRVWLIADRGLMQDDPVVFALKDWVSRWLALAGTVVVAIAIHG